jgi:hypothetical protein
MRASADTTLTVHARHYRAAAFSLFMIAAALLMTAALVDALADARLASECFGWSGIGCLHLCVICGLRYKAGNREQLPQT